jgi:acyl-CoA reductase-like NAD-dependent aldehyde dehydrogenase
MKDSYPIYLAGEFITTSKELGVINPYNGSTSTKTYLASATEVEKAINAAQGVQKKFANMPSRLKAKALLKIAEQIEERKEEFAEALTQETAKPLFYSRGEVARAVQTFTDGAEEAKRMYGEWMSLDRAESGDNHEAVVRRFPVGLVAGIAPFNFPLNLVAHKLAPAIAAGCPIILKPASKTPISALLLAKAIDNADLPKGAVSVLPMDRTTGDLLVTDGRFKLLTFTGSPAVGWDMKARVGKKKVVLELGGNAAVIVTDSAKVDEAAAKLVPAAFGQSGQSCIHTQRIYVHQSIKEELVNKMAEEAKKIEYGDPLKNGVMFSSMIDSKNADRIDGWVKEAVAGGAKLVFGGKRIEETGYAPTILTDTKNDMKVCAQEAFAPVVIIEGYSNFEDAVKQVNSSEFGLQAGVFTNKLSEVNYAYENLEVGGVIINNVSSFRADHMPYGGIKDSGLGREGVRYAIDDMTELKTLVVNKGKY